MGDSPLLVDCGSEALLPQANIICKSTHNRQNLFTIVTLMRLFQEPAASSVPLTFYHPRAENCNNTSTGSSASFSSFRSKRTIGEQLHCFDAGGGAVYLFDFHGGHAGEGRAKG